jgi:hypothetical protein
MIIVVDIREYKHGKCSAECPYCGMKVYWVHSSPVSCEKCSYILPNYSMLVKNEDERLAFHNQTLYPYDSMVEE